MKRKSQISVIILSLAVILFLGIVAGGRIMAWKAGASEMTDDMSFEQSKNSYISYYVTHPVVSYPEEYYSGDSNRVKRMTYITYDEERQAFLKVVVSDRNTSSLNRLLRAANMSDEVKKSWGDKLESELAPALVTGTLAPIEDTEAMDILMDALTGTDYKGTEEIRIIALNQSDWYMLEDGYIQGIPISNLRICTYVIGMTFLLLLIAVIVLLRKGEDTISLSESFGSTFAQFLTRQLVWIESWCKKENTRWIRMAVMTMVGVPAALTVLGIYVGGSVLEVITCHLAIGLGITELVGFSILLRSLSLNPNRILQNYGKSFEKLYPNQQERETIAQNLLETDTSWTVLEQWKELYTCAILGERYWIILSGTNKNIIVIDKNRIGKMYSKTVSARVRSGNVWYNYTNYVVYIHYQGDEEKKHANIEWFFNSEDASGHFMLLARKRLGDQAQTVMSING
ncbi:MAG: hypothetical protein K2M91_09100 [Lachnospiraceae bacterium]|nr:hypothetical protein [Lachnospiraceae bacterium]